MYRPNRLKERLAAGRRSLGLWLNLADPTAAEIAAQAGYDFLLIDNEHGPGALGDTLRQLQAMSGSPATALLRVPWNDPVYLKRALDLGVEAVMIPMVESAEQAKAAVAACRYPPLGIRGYAAGRAADYGAAEDYVATAAERLLIICQIESVRAVERVSEIAAVDGVDALFIGPYDLSGSLGKLRAFADPEVRATIARSEAGIRAAGKPMGTVPHGERGPAELFEAGYAMVAGSSDAGLLRAAARAEVAGCRRYCE